MAKKNPQFMTARSQHQHDSNQVHYTTYSELELFSTRLLQVQRWWSLFHRQSNSVSDVCVCVWADQGGFVMAWTDWRHM